MPTTRTHTVTPEQFDALEAERKTFLLVDTLRWRESIAVAGQVPPPKEGGLSLDR